MSNFSDQTRRACQMQPTPEPSVIVVTWALGIVILAVVFLDLWLGTHPGQVTVSAFLQDVSARYPILPLAVGILLGHLFWPRR